MTPTVLSPKVSTDKKPSPAFDQLASSLKSIKDAENKSSREDTPYITVNHLISTVSAAYEKIRNTISYQHDTVLRRIAIERILRRRVVVEASSTSFATNLIKELIHAGYLDNDTVPESTIADLAVIIDKYLAVLKVLSHQSRSIYGIASAEIEGALVSRLRDEALVEAFCQVIKSKIDQPEENLIYGAVCKTMLKVDQATLKYFMVIYHYPEWLEMDKIDALEARKFAQVLAMAESDIKRLDQSKYTRAIRKLVPPFIVLKDMIKQNSASADEIINNPSELHHLCRTIINMHYKITLDKLSRSIIKAVLFVLITKVVVGLVMEVPYDIYVNHDIHYLPLAVNLFFPIILMIASATLISAPGQANTNRLVRMIDELVYSQDSLLISQVMTVKREAGSGLTMIINGLYFLTCAGILALIVWMLISLDFSPVSGVLFFIFLSTVSFLALRIRKTTATLMVVEEKEGLLATLLDFLLLPFLSLGHWISHKFEKSNVFLFIFDFILEAPFKTILEVLEQWIGFVRTKKDEIVY